jgi:hypothetical protein
MTMLQGYLTIVRAHAAALCDWALDHVPVLRAEAPMIVKPEPLAPAERWSRATGMITSALGSFDRVSEYQTAASTRLDAADYTLQHILEDLAAVMPIPTLQPADGSELRAVLAEADEQPYELVDDKDVMAA